VNAAREELWVAMSDLWLDTELPEERLAEIAGIVRKSGLSRAELESVFESELAPILGANTLAPAGEWAGFDPAWVCEQARRRVGRRSFSARLLARLGVTTYAARPAWKRVISLAFGREG
jgi:hypothetical protein